MLKRMLPAPLKKALKKPYYRFLDLVEKRDELTPPRSMIFVGRGDFSAVGNQFKQFFIDAGLKPTDNVLDVGCGIGRMAVPITDYLTGQYQGIDIVKQGIDWCQNHITPRFPNFRFIHADIYNMDYNSKGKIRASEFVFPFKDGYFDFVFLTSVFTHMLPDDVENYVSEISRVLSGKCLITFFLVDNADFEKGGYLHGSKNLKIAIAYREEYVRHIFHNVGLTIEAIHYGSWNGVGGPHYQDIIIAHH